MISHTLLRDDGVLLYLPKAPLEANDFQELAGEVDPYIAEHGKLQGLMIVAERFPGWRNFAGFRSQCEFVKQSLRQDQKDRSRHRQQVVDRFSRECMSDLLGRKVRYFGHADRETALAWLRQVVHRYRQRFRHRPNCAMEAKPV